MKRAFIYLTLLAIALSLGLINAYLWRLQNRTQEHIADLRQQVGLHLRENKLLNDRNDALRINVDSLKSPDAYRVYEEKAREDYGMIGKNETYFVLPDSEMANIPDIPGLVEREKRQKAANLLLAAPQLPGNARPLDQKLTLESVNPAPDGTGNDDQTVAPIPVSPVPLQLEALQYALQCLWVAQWLQIKWRDEGRSCNTASHANTVSI